MLSHLLPNPYTEYDVQNPKFFKIKLSLIFVLKWFVNIYISLVLILGDRGSTVVNVLCYKSEGRWFDPSWCHWNFSLI